MSWRFYLDTAPAASSDGEVDGTETAPRSVAGALVTPASLEALAG